MSFARGRRREEAIPKATLRAMISPFALLVSPQRNGPEQFLACLRPHCHWIISGHRAG